jgi:hypothetical protein
MERLKKKRRSFLFLRGSSGSMLVSVTMDVLSSCGGEATVSFGGEVLGVVGTALAGVVGFGGMVG